MQWIEQLRGETVSLVPGSSDRLSLKNYTNFRLYKKW